MSEKASEETFCESCAKEEFKYPFFLNGGDLDSEMEFCSPTCVLLWVADTYEVDERIKKAAEEVREPVKSTAPTEGWKEFREHMPNHDEDFDARDAFMGGYVKGMHDALVYVMDRDIKSAVEWSKTIKIGKDR